MGFERSNTMLTNLTVQAQYWDWPGPWHMGWGFGFGWIFPVLMIFFMIAICMFLMGHMPWGRSHNPASSALQLLAERFAKGEISKEEFEEKRNILAPRR
jgi:putative membrane protein